MDIRLEKRAIVLKLHHDAVNLKPLMYFIENSFSTVKNFSNITIVRTEPSELIKKKYLLKWACNLYYKNIMCTQQLDFKKLNESMHLPIHVISIDSNKSIYKTHVTQSAKIIVNHTVSNKLTFTTNLYHTQILQYLRIVFEDSLVDTHEKTAVTIKIKTKKELLVLKKVLGYKKISNISVKFMTKGLNLNKIYTQQTNPQEQAYIEKLNKSYKVLSITNNSTYKEIKSNYKKMLRKYHPDRVYNDNTDKVELYTKRFQVIQEAYQLIIEHRGVA